MDSILIVSNICSFTDIPFEMNSLWYQKTFKWRYIIIPGKAHLWIYQIQRHLFYLVFLIHEDLQLVIYLCTFFVFFFLFHRLDFVMTPIFPNFVLTPIECLFHLLFLLELDAWDLQDSNRTDLLYRWKSQLLPFLYTTIEAMLFTNYPHWECIQ